MIRLVVNSADQPKSFFRFSVFSTKKKLKGELALAYESELLHVSLVSGLELKMCGMHIKMLRNSSKKSWERRYCQGLGQNSLISNLNSYCSYDYYVSNSMIRVVVKFC